MGKLVTEIRHEALMFRLIDAGQETFSEAKYSILNGFISGYLFAVSGRSFAVLDLGNMSGDRLFWAGNPDAVKNTRQCIGRGVQPLAAIDALMTGDTSC
jgi:hypothetical protein